MRAANLNRPSGSPLVLLAVAALLVFSGCGDNEQADTDQTEKKADQELLALVSTAIERQGESAQDVIEYADFTFARKQLGIPANENIYEGPLAPFIGPLAYAATPETSPLVRAIDGRAIQAVAGRPVLGFPALVAIRTTQSFNEIAAALTKDGYVRRKDVLVSSGNSSLNGFSVVADTEDGVVVLGGSSEFVQGVLAHRSSELSDGAKLIDAVPGPIRTAQSKNSKCVVAGAVGQNLSPKQGEYVLQVKGTPSKDNVTLPTVGTEPPNGKIEFGEVSTTGDQIRVPFTYSDSLNAAAAAIPIVGSSYEC